MKRHWQYIKNILGACERDNDLFLSLIDQEGVIYSANSMMVRSLQLKNPKNTKINFFDLVHPVNLEVFKKAIRDSSENNRPGTAELYVKNGFYHPMKWQFNCLNDTKGNEKAYLCVGHKIIDKERLEIIYRMDEKNYHLITEERNKGVLFQDNKGELIAVNQKLAEIFSTTLEKLYQMKDMRSLWNSNQTIILKEGKRLLFDETPFMRSLITGKPQHRIFTVRLGNGKDRRIKINSKPLFKDPDKAPYSVVSVITDITSERKLIRETTEQESLFRTFINKTPNLAWLVDEDAKLVFASQAFYQYFGLDEKNSVSKKLTDLLPGPVSKVLYEKHVRVLQTALPDETVQKIQLADGTNIVFHINIFPIDGVCNKKILAGHAVNLNDAYAAEKQLRETNDRLLLLTRATSDAIWEWDMQTGNIFRNDALMDMIGYQPEDKKGLTWWLRRIHPEDRNRVSRKVRNTIEKGLQSWEDQYRLKCSDGNYKHMNDKGFVVYENGLPVKMIGSLHDITMLKKLENELIEEKLERQKEITETVMRVQEKERTRIGHELHDNVNQILSTVRMFVDMLTPSGKEEKEIKTKTLEYIMLAIEELRKLSKELVMPQLKGNGLADSIRTLIEDIQLSDFVKIKFTHDKDIDLLSPGKKLTFFRIVQEQIKNIMNYSGAKQAEINLQLKDNHAELTVKDNGVGFNPKQTHRGIGLSNIYERTRFYEGTVDIKTSPGNGCTLTVSIPFL
jgi:PAS domain S-box-containing protein